MTITWQSVAAPNQSSANQLMGDAQKSILNGIGGIQKMFQDKQTRNDAEDTKARELLLGKLQAGLAGVGANQTVTDILDMGLSGKYGELGGKELSALATSVAAQQGKLDNLSLDRNKLDTQNQQFAETMGLKRQELGQQTAYQQGQLGLNERELALRNEQFGAGNKLDWAKFGLDKEELAARVAQDKRIADQQAVGKALSPEDQAYLASSQMMMTPEFAAMNPEEKQQALLPFMKPSEAAKLITPEGGFNKAGGGTKAVDSAVDFFAKDPRFKPNDVITAKALISKGVANGVPADTMAAYLYSIADSDKYWFKGNMWGSQDLTKNGFDPEGIVEFAKEKGLPLPAHLQVDPNVRDDARAAIGLPPISKPENVAKNSPSGVVGYAREIGERMFGR